MTDFAGKKVILNIFPSVDTGTCASLCEGIQSKRQADLENTVVLCISRDLPFAHARFCGAEGIRKRYVMLSDFAEGNFGKAYRLDIANGPLAHFTFKSNCQSLDENGNIEYTEQVSEIADEPNYTAALKAL